MKKGFAPIVIISAAALLISASLVFAFLQKNQTPEKTTPSPSPVPQYQTDETVYTEESPSVSTEDSRSANWKTYNLNGILSFKYPPDYSTFDSSIKNYPGVDVYDKKEHLGPANLYLSIKATSGGSSDYDAIYKDYTDLARENSTMENFPNGFKIIYRDKTGYKYQVDTFYKYKNGYVRAYYRSVPGIPSEVYDQILSTFKFLD